MKIQNDFYSLTPYENILAIETFLAWDERVLKDYYTDIKNIAKKFYHDKPWAVLVDRRGWVLHTPEAQQANRKRLLTKTETPLSHIALILDNSQLKKWQVDKITAQVTDIKIKVFADPQSAKEWLESLGYHMSPIDSIVNQD